RPPLRKLPFRFYYRYGVSTDEGVELNRHLLTDWEVGALYWNCLKNYRKAWEAPFRAKLVDEMRSRDLLLVLGTVHRFPDQWLIVGLVYPPHQAGTQLELPALGQ
ncbi:MAG: hypothetical protein V1772_06620, partial [Chloroflexota bacterium]